MGKMLEESEKMRYMGPVRYLASLYFIDHVAI